MTQETMKVVPIYTMEMARQLKRENRLPSEYVIKSKANNYGCLFSKILNDKIEKCVTTHDNIDALNRLN